jgi:hypothetical protein
MYKFYVDGTEIDTPMTGVEASRCLKFYKDQLCKLFQMIDVGQVVGDHVGFEYVEIASNGNDGMERWINLFFNGEIVALVENEVLADQIKKSIPKMILKTSRLTNVEPDTRSSAESLVQEASAG